MNSLRADLDCHPPVLFLGFPRCSSFVIFKSTWYLAGPILSEPFSLVFKPFCELVFDTAIVQFFENLLVESVGLEVRITVDLASCGLEESSVRRLHWLGSYLCLVAYLLT